tara:strand:+ start:140 stop:760 length:621 start_codon:yes stop_codon:yes gene_type:complete
MNKTVKQMTNEGKGILGNATQKMNQLSSQAQVEYRRTLGALNTQIGKMKGKLSQAQQTALTELKKKREELRLAHQNAMKGYDPNDTGATFMNGFNQAVAGSKKALESAKKGVKAAKKFTKDAEQAYKNTVASSIQIQDTSKAQGKVKGGPMSRASRFGGRKRRTRRKRRKKGRKSRRKGRKSRRSRRKKRKGRKSRRKKRRTRRRR